MMMANEESSKLNIDDFGSSRLLQDIEEISKALYLHDTPQNQLPQKPNYINKNLSPHEKRSSIWKWKPLKALTHIRDHRLNSLFFLHIHSIEGLPINFNNLILRVYWKRKNEILKTQSIRVKEGVAEFNETLIHRCSVYVSKSGPHDDVAKYEPKSSLLYVSIVGAPGLDLGKHWIDLTRLLPINLIDLEDEKNRFGKWVTGFKLSGKAKGAIINVSFGFSLSGDKLLKINGKENGMLQRSGSIPRSSKRGSRLANLSFDISNSNEVFTPSINFLYELLDDPNSSYNDDVLDDEFTVIDKGIELVKDELKKEDESVDSIIETINVAELFDDDEELNDEIYNNSNNYKNNNLDTEESNIEELELFLHNLSISENSADLDFSFHENLFLEQDHDMKKGKMVKSRSLDDLIINDFINMVDSDSEPESPRERLLREFEKETLISTNFDYNFELKEKEINNSNIFDSSFLFQENEDDEVGPSIINRRKAKLVENLETEALMKEWGITEGLFVNSPRTNSGAFGSPVYLSPERLPELLPAIGEGLGSFLKIENGGFLRSMNPLIFRKVKNGERLIVQVTDSVVLPMEMGSNGLDLLMKWATVGSEKMGLQIESLMPIEVITGKTLQKTVWEAESEMEVFEREGEFLHESEPKETSTKVRYETNSEYVSINNIIPSTIEKIQFLLIEGLKIQSGISNEDPPSIIPINKTKTNEIDNLINKNTKFNSINGNSNDEFTLSLQLLLRDPLRDYEPVGIPMLALIQVEKSWSTDSVDQMFKVNEVCVSGFRADFLKKQQSGFRWLNSSGLNYKTKRSSLSKSNALMRSSIRSMNNLKVDEVFWSVSYYVHGDVDKWKELSGLNLYVRNPDIVFK